MCKMKKKKLIKISIVLANLSAGGAERVLSFIACELDTEKFQCTLVIVGHKKDVAYDINGVKAVFFEKPRVLTGIPQLFMYLLKDKPDIVLSAVAHMNTVTAYLSIFFKKTKFIAREVTILSVAKTINPNKKSKFDYFADKRFNYFDKIICQSKDMYDDMNEHNKIDQDKLVIINNPISNGFDLKAPGNSSDVLRLVTVGSFKKVKGHLRLIEALAKLTFDFHYTLIGDGPEKDKIFDLISKLGMTEKITHIPFTPEVAKHLAVNDIFLQGSYIEGFPNALLECCSVGLPVLAFNSPGGHNEIIIDGVNGHMLASEEEFIKKLNMINQNNYFDPNEVRESVTSRYGKDIIITKYETLFTELIS